MTTRKSNKKSFALVAIIVIAVLAVSAVAQMTTKTQTGTGTAVSLTDPNLVAAQKRQDALLANEKVLSEQKVRLQQAYQKIADLQAAYRAGEAEWVAKLAKKDSDVQMYHNLWQQDRRITPWYASMYAGVFYGVVALLFLQWSHRRILAIHGSYRKWLRHVWLNRPRISWRGGAAHG